MKRNPPGRFQKFFKCSCGASFYDVIEAGKKSQGCTKCKGLAWAQKNEVPEQPVVWKVVVSLESFCPMCGSRAVRLRAKYFCTNRDCNYRAS